jgi:hypothetical protein
MWLLEKVGVSMVLIEKRVAQALGCRIPIGNAFCVLLAIRPGSGKLSSGT